MKIHSREVDRLHADQVGVIEDVAGQEVGAPQHEAAGEAAERAWLDAAGRGERILHAVVFLGGQGLDATRRRG